MTASGKKRASRRQGGGGGKAPGSAIVWIVVAAVAAGLLWVAWPALFPPPARPPKRADTVRQAERLSSEHPDAEVLNPEGGDVKKN